MSDKELTAEDFETHLSQSDLHFINIESKNNQLRLSKHQILEMKLAHLRVERELIDTKMILMQKELQESKASLDAKARHHKDEMVKLRARYGVGPTDDFGIDPLSGEIKRN